MNDKYSLAKCEHYGRRLAAHLCGQHFDPTPDTTLDGPAILRFTPIRQLNLLVVRQLFQQWQADTSRLRSPYFNFEAPAVRDALGQFQNVLSRHISLGRATFEPLLAYATSTALHLAADPATAFASMFLTKEPAPTVAQLQHGLRYLDLNKTFFADFLQTLATPEASIPNALLIEQLTSYQQEHYRQQQPMQQLIAALSALFPLTEADLRLEGPAATVAAPPPVATAPTPVASTLATPAPQQAPADPIPATALSEDAPLHEKLKATQPVSQPLATTLRATQPAGPPLAERGAPKVETLREAISINQRFSFINELFNGENMEYHAAIQHLDGLTDPELARLYVTQQLAQRYDWSRKEEHVAKLLKLVERRYVPV